MTEVNLHSNKIQKSMTMWLNTGQRE